MPQYHRAVAFSTKKKKEQLQAKRQRKKEISNEHRPNLGSSSDKLYFHKGKKNNSSFNITKLQECSSNKNNYFDDVEEIGISKNCQSSSRSRYNLKFRKTILSESDRAKLHHEPLVQLTEEELEVSSDQFFPLGLNYPKRPPWNRNMSKVHLDQSENKSFRTFCDEIDKTFPKDDLSLYELNLETWRQLWRVTEMSDIIFLIVDVRYCVAQFPPYLYEDLTENKKKDVILILNKCDLLPASQVLAWQDYFLKKFPKVSVLCFSTFEGRLPKKSSFKIASQSSRKLIEACERFVGENVDLSSWKQKVEEDEAEGFTRTQAVVVAEHKPENLEFETYERYKNGILTIGTVGYPNVGKSSLINALMGKKVVSVSRTPGHTKHFQTIFLTRKVKLCDCPGLVFPSICPKQLQVLVGSFPVAQVRDPISAVSFVAARIDLPALLKIDAENATDAADEDFHWTPFLICEAWARKRGFYTRTKGGRLDAHRAANELLRLALGGLRGVVVSLLPPGYSANKEFLEDDPRCAEIPRTHGQETVATREASEDEDSDSEDSDDGEGAEGQSSDSESESEDGEDAPPVEANKFAVLQECS